ncbi:MAG: hypothetical protein KAX31_07575 [Thermoplasmata archaeon]|nr:hypothetical protein [Thermoplasmata archaeon]
MIVETLDKIVDHYRIGGAPIVTFTEGDSVVARIASSEFHVLIVSENGPFVVINFDSKPRVSCLVRSVKFLKTDTESIIESIRKTYLLYTSRLAEKGIYPFCGTFFNGEFNGKHTQGSPK